MDFLKDVEEGYGKLPNVTVNYDHSSCLTISVSDVPVMKVALWSLSHIPLYHVVPTDGEGISSVSMREARLYIWAYYLDAIGDLV